MTPEKPQYVAPQAAEAPKESEAIKADAQQMLERSADRNAQWTVLEGLIKEHSQTEIKDALSSIWLDKSLRPTFDDILSEIAGEMGEDPDDPNFTKDLLNRMFSEISNDQEFLKIMAREYFKTPPPSHGALTLEWEAVSACLDFLQIDRTLYEELAEIATFPGYIYNYSPLDVEYAYDDQNRLGTLLRGAFMRSEYERVFESYFDDDRSFHNDLGLALADAVPEPDYSGEDESLEKVETYNSVVADFVDRMGESKVKSILSDEADLYSFLNSHVPDVADFFLENMVDYIAEDKAFVAELKSIYENPKTEVGKDLKSYLEMLSIHSFDQEAESQPVEGGIQAEIAIIEGHLAEYSDVELKDAVQAFLEATDSNNDLMVMFTGIQERLGKEHNDDLFRPFMETIVDRIKTDNEFLKAVIAEYCKNGIHEPVFFDEIIFATVLRSANFDQAFFDMVTRDAKKAMMGQLPLDHLAKRFKDIRTEKMYEKYFSREARELLDIATINFPEEDLNVKLIAEEFLKDARKEDMAELLKNPDDMGLLIDSMIEMGGGLLAEAVVVGLLDKFKDEFRFLEKLKKTYGKRSDGKSGIVLEKIETLISISKQADDIFING